MNIHETILRGLFFRPQKVSKRVCRWQLNTLFCDIFLTESLTVMVTLGHFLISCFSTKLFMSEKLLIFAKIHIRTIILSLIFWKFVFKLKTSGFKLYKIKLREISVNFSSLGFLKTLFRSSENPERVNQNRPSPCFGHVTFLYLCVLVAYIVYGKT